MGLLLRLLHVGAPNVERLGLVASHARCLAAMKGDPFLCPRPLMIWVLRQCIEQGNGFLWPPSPLVQHGLATLLLCLAETQADLVAGLLGLIKPGLHHVDGQVPGPVLGPLGVFLHGARNVALGTDEIVQALPNKASDKKGFRRQCVGCFPPPGEHGLGIAEPSRIALVHGGDEGLLCGGGGQADVVGAGPPCAHRGIGFAVATGRRCIVQRQKNFAINWNASRLGQERLNQPQA